MQTVEDLLNCVSTRALGAFNRLHSRGVNIVWPKPGNWEGINWCRQPSVGKAEAQPTQS